MNKSVIIIFLFISIFASSQTQEYNNQQQIILNLNDSAGKCSWDSPLQSIKYAEKAEKLAKEINFIDGIVNSLQTQSTAYYIQGITDKALKKGLEAIRLCEKHNYYKGISSISNSMGLIYQDLKNYDESIKYFDIAMKYGDRKRIDIPLNNKANSLYYLKKYKESIELHEQALNNRLKRNDISGVADCKNDIGIIYIDLKQYEKAYTYINYCYTKKEELNEKEGIAFSASDMAHLFVEWNKPQKAIKYIDRAYEMSQIMNSPRYKEMCYGLYAKTYNLSGDYAKAYKYQLLFSNLRDSLRNNESIKQIANMQTKYDTEKKEQALKLKSIQFEKEKLENKKKTLQRNYTLIGLLLVIVLVIIIFKSYRNKQKANNILKSQKDEIAEKNEELNQQNEEITAQRDEIEKQKEIAELIHKDLEQSIDYATRLQESILPESDLLDKYNLEHFILFKPKDKVSGDFYWWYHTEGQTIITVADSTGHGVPGAFMSMLGISLLREIIVKEYITHTGVILNKMRKGIIKILKQKGKEGEQKDGMDMAIISINHETNMVQFSGANNPLYIITERTLSGFENLTGLVDNSNFKLYEIKPDKMPIAIYEKKERFSAYEIQLEKGDIVFMFTDGFADQFGGEKGKKFKYKPFKRLLLEDADKSMAEQKEILEIAFSKWKGFEEQVDDVTVMGIRL